MFTVTFYRPERFEKLLETYWDPFINSTQHNLLWQVYKNPNISKRELSENLELSKTAIDKNIEKLKELGILQRVGSDRGGSWKIILKRITER